MCWCNFIWSSSDLGLTKLNYIEGDVQKLQMKNIKGLPNVGGLE